MLEPLDLSLHEVRRQPELSLLTSEFQGKTPAIFVLQQHKVSEIVLDEILSDACVNPNFVT